MPDERLPARIQDSIATAIAMAEDDDANLIASLAEVDTFDPPLDDVVARCLEYRKEFKRAPGTAHIDDVVAHVLDDPNHKQYKAYERIVLGMLDQHHTLDTAFVLSKISEFTQVRKLRGGIAKAVERYQKGGATVTDDLQAIFRECLKIKAGYRDYGFSLSDEASLGFLNRDETMYCRLGISAVDDVGCVPTKQELLVFMAARNRGKSLFAHHCGKMAVLQGWRVFHYTLENSAEWSSYRYYASLFSGVRHEDDYYYAKFNGKSDTPGLEKVKLRPNFVLDNRAKTLEYLQRRKKEDLFLSNVRIRRFPTGKPTIGDLEKDLDEIELVHRERPDLLIIDSPQLMRYDRKHEFAELGEIYIKLRGLAIERDVAVVATHQGNRRAESASTVTGSMIAGSIDIIGIADNAIAYSQTASEEEHGLARLYLQKVRNDRARGIVCLTQHYGSSQFVMDSRPMTNRIREVVSEFTGHKRVDDDVEVVDENETEYERERVASGR